MSDSKGQRELAARRAFLQRSLALAGALLVGGPALRGTRVQGAPPAPPSAEKPLPTEDARKTTHVLEARFVGLRDEDGSVKRSVLEDAVLGLVQTYKGDYPLDALSSIFPDDPPVSVLVDARSGARATTPVLATVLAGALRDMGSKGDAVIVSDVSDADLIAGGYRIARDGEGPLCHGDTPKPGYGESRDLPGGGKTFRLSRALDDGARRVAVVARLHAREGRMGPFVLDAALRALDDPTRKKAQQDPRFGASVLASAALGGRVELVIGELFELELGPSRGEAGTVWKADELLAGDNLFAVERIGYTILSNTVKARGGAPLPEPPLLAAGAALGASGAKMPSIAWTKANV